MLFINIIPQNQFGFYKRFIKNLHSLQTVKRYLLIEIMTVPLTTRQIRIYERKGVAQDDSACYLRCDGYFPVDSVTLIECMGF